MKTWKNLVLLAGMLSICFSLTVSAQEETDSTQANEVSRAAEYEEAADRALSVISTQMESAWDHYADQRFEGYDEWMENSHLMLGSYWTDNVFMKDVAFTYDNALAAMAWIADDNPDGPVGILNSFVYAVNHDRYANGRIRNAYAVGNINPFPGSDLSSARLPGWYDEELQQWFEDQYQVGCNTGNTSYAALALLQYDAAYGNETYFETARQLMDWVIENCSDGGDGFIAGYNGWPEADPPVVYPLTYKSIEHNIDAYAAFSRLYDVTGEEKYHEAAESCLRFIDSMYDAERGLFYAGTDDDGVTITTEPIVLDAQVWAALSLGDAFSPYAAALDTAYAMKNDEGGYPFCQENLNGGWWTEGTAFTALLWRTLGMEERYEESMNLLCSVQPHYDMFSAASTDHLSTGIYQFDGSALEYSTDPHLAPTAWFVLAVKGFNPYRFPAGS